MALHILTGRSYGGKLPVSIKCHDIHSFKEGVILLCQSILETKQISHLHGLALFTIPLRQSKKKIRRLLYTKRSKCIFYSDNITIYKSTGNKNKTLSIEEYLNKTKPYS